MSRVAIYMSSLEGGGAERAMVDLANGLQSHGLTTDLVVIRDEGPWRALLSSDVRLTAIRSRWALTALAKLVRYLHRARPDVVVANGTSSIILAIFARILSPRFAVVARIPVNLSAGLAEVNLKWRVIRATQARLLPRVDAIVTNSLGSSTDIHRTLPAASARVRTIHNPVVWPGLPKLAQMAVEHPWFQREDMPIVLAAGRLEPQKDHATLIRAFSLVGQHRDLRLVVLGEGSQRRNLVNLTHELGVADRVDLPGFHANPFAFMAKSRLFVVSSTQEGMPNVLIQAMACGTPVVSTDCPSGPREVLEDGKWGRLVPVGDPERLADAMLATLDDPPASDALVARADVFSAEASVRADLGLFEDLRR